MFTIFLHTRDSGMLQYAILADIEGGLSEFLVFGFIYGRYVDENACVCTAVLTLLVNVHSRFSSFELVRVIRPRTPRLQCYYEGCGDTPSLAAASLAHTFWRFISSHVVQIFSYFSSVLVIFLPCLFFLVFPLLEDFLWLFVSEI